MAPFALLLPSALSVMLLAAERGNAQTHTQAGTSKAALEEESKMTLIGNRQEEGLESDEENDPGIQFFRPGGGPSHKLWPFNGRMPCACQGLGCGCCAEMVVSSLGFNRTGCMNLTYEPYDFAVVARFFFGESMLFERSFSGKNPPPLCMPMPVPYVPSVDLCVRFFDIYTPGRNLHLCMDWVARLQRAPVVILHFDCMRVGRDGVALLKPEDGDGLPSSTTPAMALGDATTLPPATSTQDPDSVYDEVAPGRVTENSSDFEGDEDTPGGEEDNENPATDEGTLIPATEQTTLYGHSTPSVNASSNTSQ